MHYTGLLHEKKQSPQTCHSAAPDSKTFNASLANFQQPNPLFLLTTDLFTWYNLNINAPKIGNSMFLNRLIRKLEGAEKEYQSKLRALSLIGPYFKSLTDENSSKNLSDAKLTELLIPKGLFPPTGLALESLKSHCQKEWNQLTSPSGTTKSLEEQQKEYQDAAVIAGYLLYWLQNDRTVADVKSDIDNSTFGDGNGRLYDNLSTKEKTHFEQMTGDDCQSAYANIMHTYGRNMYSDFMNIHEKAPKIGYAVLATLCFASSAVSAASIAFASASLGVALGVAIPLLCLALFCTVGASRISKDTENANDCGNFDTNTWKNAFFLKLALHPFKPCLESSYQKRQEFMGDKISEEDHPMPALLSYD